MTVSLVAALKCKETTYDSVGHSGARGVSERSATI